MNLTSLLMQYSAEKEALEETREAIMDRERTHERTRKSIAAVINEEFRKFVDNFNKSVPEDQRVTEWHVHYDGGIRKAFISIRGLSGKRYESEEWAHELPLPDFLQGLNRFGQELSQDYSIKAYFRMINHKYLDIPISEME